MRSEGGAGVMSSIRQLPEEDGDKGMVGGPLGPRRFVGGGIISSMRSHRDEGDDGGLPSSVERGTWRLGLGGGIMSSMGRHREEGDGGSGGGIISSMLWHREEGGDGGPSLTVTEGEWWVG